MNPEIHTWQEMEALVLEYGFLPFFANAIGGWSIEEHTPESLWFSDTEEGPWEWKGPCALHGKCAYGKFFQNKAGFVSLRWLPDFINYRRDGYDFDSRVEEGLVSSQDQQVYQVLSDHKIMISKQLKQDAGYGRNGKKGFDAIITRLQMETYVCTQNFVYDMDRHGNAYGWGNAEFTTPEVQYGKARVTSAYQRSPEESLKRIMRHLKKVLPDAAEDDIYRMIRRK